MFVLRAYECGAAGTLSCPSGYAKADKTQCEAFVTSGESCPGTLSHAYGWKPNPCASGSSTSWCNERPHGCWQDNNGGVFYNEVPTGDGSAYYQASPICYQSPCIHHKVVQKLVIQYTPSKTLKT